MAVTRGFVGRRASARDPRLPPGQYDVGSSWPVLTAESTPSIGTDRFRLTVDGAVEEQVTWDWAQLRALPGWVSHLAWRASRTGDATLTDYVAIRLSLLRALNRDEPPPAGTLVPPIAVDPEWITRVSDLVNDPANDRRECLLPV